jgi:hypothetical protein
MGKLQPDRFSGGMQLTVNQVWDLPAGALPLRQVPAGRGEWRCTGYFATGEASFRHASRG